jgi:hypothetical protein
MVWRPIQATPMPEADSAHLSLAVGVKGFFDQEETLALVLSAARRVVLMGWQRMRGCIGLFGC